jgi:large subunit ribosomal protein L17
MSSHMIRGRQLSRDTEHRISLRRSLVQSLIEHGKIRTTLPKAKEVRAFAEKLITLARTGTLTARRRVIAHLNDRRLVDESQEFTGQTVVQKLFSEIAPKFADRPGGYTRIIKTSKHRIGDGGSIVVLELAHEASPPKGTVRRSAGLRRKRNERKHQFASRLKKGEKQTTEATASAPSESAPQ